MLLQGSRGRKVTKFEPKRSNLLYCCPALDGMDKTQCQPCGFLGLLNLETVLIKRDSIRGTALNWFNSYLCNRKQFVSVNGHSSSPCDISCGVPQGSVLGPLLFLIYINDLPNSSKFFSFFLFADDTNIYCESDDLTLLTRKVNKD